MKKLKHHPLYRFRWILVAIPYFLAMAGYIDLYFITYPDHFTNVSTFHLITAVFYNSFKIYGMSVSAELYEMSILFEVARLAGALATTSVIVKVGTLIYNKIHMWRMVRNPDALIIHGNGVLKETVLQTLEKTSIGADGELSFDAKQHVLAFDQDEEALRYIIKHQKELFTDNKMIYFLSTKYEASDYGTKGLIVSNIAANCARLYWAQHWIQEDAIRRVAIIGFGDYGRHLLEQALLVNVLPWRSSIEYHVFGSDGKDYLIWHPQLKDCLSINQADDKQDSIHFHPYIIPDDFHSLNEFDRIILTEDKVEDNLMLLDQMLHMGVHKTIHIRCSKDLLDKLQYIPSRYRVHVSSFGNPKDLYNKEVIIHGQLLQTAKENHLTYVHQSKATAIHKKYASCKAFANCSVNNGTCGNCPNAAATWNDLAPFEKDSNIAVADHEHIKRELLEKAAKRGGIEACKYDLCRAEHIRWMRFSFLHNWQYNAVRDNEERHHHSLLPFEQLSQEEQEKDWWSYHLILNSPKKEENA